MELLQRDRELVLGLVLVDLRQQLGLRSAGASGIEGRPLLGAGLDLRCQWRRIPRLSAPVVKVRLIIHCCGFPTSPDRHQDS